MKAEKQKKIEFHFSAFWWVDLCQGKAYLFGPLWKGIQNIKRIFQNSLSFCLSSRVIIMMAVREIKAWATKGKTASSWIFCSLCLKDRFIQKHPFWNLYSINRSMCVCVCVSVWESVYIYIFQIKIGKIIITFALTILNAGVNGHS